jgi:hypothetical protein
MGPGAAAAFPPAAACKLSYLHALVAAKHFQQPGNRSVNAPIKACGC